MKHLIIYEPQKKEDKIIEFMENLSESEHDSDDSNNTESTESSHTTSISDCAIGNVKLSFCFVHKF